MAIKSFLFTVWGLLAVTVILPTTGHKDFLNGILRTFQEHACDGEELELKCTNNTIISISLVQYGIPPPVNVIVDSGAGDVRTSSSQGKSQGRGMSSSSLASAASSQLEGQLHQANLCTVRRRHQQLQQQHKEVINGHPSSSPPYAYGSSASPNQRNSRVTSSSTSNSSSLIGSSGDSNNINNNNNMISSRDGRNCNSTEDLRYAFLRSVEETCREKTSCRIMTPLSNFSIIDPCPDVPKVAEVAYKCRPNIFYNKVACEGNTLQLRCREKDEVIAIFKAFYGSTGETILECPSKSSSVSDGPLPSPSSLVRGGRNKNRTPQLASRVIDNEDRFEDNYEDDDNKDNPENGKRTSGRGKSPYPVCQASFATERLVKRCGGLRNCTVPVDQETLGTSTCKPGTDLHLKVTYACVLRQILKGFVAVGTGAKETGGNLDTEKQIGHESPSAPPATSKDDYAGFVDAPRYVPDSENGLGKGGSEGRILPGFDPRFPASTSGTRDPRTGTSSIHELKKFLERERERELELVDKQGKTPSEEEESVDESIGGSKDPLTAGSSLSHHHLLRRPPSQSINPSDSSPAEKTRWMTRIMEVFVDSASRFRGSHSRKIIWYMVIVVSVGVLVSLLFVAGLMGSQTYASYLEGRRNKRRRKNQVKTEEDGKSSSPPLPSLFHDDHNHQHHHHSGKKSPSPPTFDVSSDEILQDLQAEGLVRSPTLVDYRHEDNYGFLPSHVPPASMIQAHLSGQQNHYNDLQSQDHHHHDHYSHPRSLSNPLTTPSLQGDDGESSDVTTTSSNLHSHHLCQHHREHPIVHYTTNPSCCLGESLTHCGQTHIQPSILTGGVGEHSSVSIHLANSADQPQLPPSLRFNHVYPVLRTSHPNLHQVLQTDLDSLESQPLDMNTSCSHAITSNINTSTVTTSSSSVLPSLSTLSPQRLFHTLGRSSHRNNHFLHHHHPHYGVSDKRLSTIDRNSFLLKENHPKVACTETTPPRGLMDNENHYY